MNIKMELWKRAHELEAKAMEDGDILGVAEAAEWKGRFGLALMQEIEKEPADEPESGGLSHVGASDE